MNGYNTYAQSQIITENPVRKEPSAVQRQYYAYLKRLLHQVKWDDGKYAKAQLSFYESVLCGEDGPASLGQDLEPIRPFCYLIPFDVIALLSFRRRSLLPRKLEHITDAIAANFKLPSDTKKLLRRAFAAAQVQDPNVWRSLLRNSWTVAFHDYLRFVRDNLTFSREAPYPILITATMSAGKSTLINAFVGKNISLTQNMACTSKIHTIVSKFSEDGITTEYDYELSVDASREDLLTDNANNETTQIVVSTCFHGPMKGQRILIHDSPGVNSSENAEHAVITNRLIQSRRYRLLLYVLNATQLGTTDEARHLEHIAHAIGRRKVLFVMNKCDHLISEDESLPDVIARQQEFLKNCGFKAPIICPVSARAAFLAKKSQLESLSRLERRELDNFIDKFIQSGLGDYYEKELGCTPIPAAEDEVESLYRDCGLAYLERIIMQYKEER